MVGVVFIGDLIYCPYLDKYLMILNEHNMKYEVLYWNRDTCGDIFPENYIAYQQLSELNKSKINKAADFFKFGQWLKKTVNARNYDRLIILSTLSGMVLASTLLRKYKNKYIFDIRDYSYENIFLFRMIESKLISQSEFTCISSNGFKRFLPRYDYKLAHNFNYTDLDFERTFSKKSYGSVLNIVWMGVIRYFDHQSKIIDQLKNDERFNLIYHGEGPELERLRKYCNDNEINNVVFTGKYDNRCKSMYIGNADILNNSYGSKCTYEKHQIQYAVSNKYYDSLIYRVPQLVESETYKGDLVCKSGVGISIDVTSEQFADKLYAYYFDINEETFNNHCKAETQNILDEDKKYLASIKKFVFKTEKEIYDAYDVLATKENFQ